MAPSGARIEIQGIKKLARTLRQAGDEEGRAMLLAANKDAATMVAQAAAPLVPQRTGRLAATLRSSGTAKGGVVMVGRARVPYAGPVHFGWFRRRIKANPFLYEAMDRRRSEVEEAYQRRLAELLERIEGV